MEKILLRPFYFFLLMAAAAAAGGGGGGGGTDPISYALLSLKFEFVDDSNSLNDWVISSASGADRPAGKIYACSWTGIRCSDNSSKFVSLDLSMKNLGGSLSGKQFGLFSDLVDLNLSHNSFSGQLPAGVFNLTNLESLDISRNNFSGGFPSGIPRLRSLVVLDAFSNSFAGNLPADVSQVESLKVLNFAGSYFSGPIPLEYGSFKSLEFIHLAGNFLGGGIPPELGNLRFLSHMEIGYNSYEGEIPWQFGNMSDLQYLDIADANISGQIPKQLSNLTKLESLFLFKNQLTGKLPPELSKISSLKSLDLSDNLISGEIPESFSELKNLTLLSLMYNELSGPVPPSIANLPNLDTLLIWNNYFTGSLPQNLGRNSKLQHVDVSTNFFSGNIPPEICSGGGLLKLILFSNNFTGGLSPSLSNCSSLIRLRIEDNSFSGEISLRFSNLPFISYVDLSRNKFTGGIPSDIAQASFLEYFNVSDNQELGGEIPLKTWSLPNLRNFSMESCGISGNIPPFEPCKSVSVLELRTNNLTGGIPLTVSNCKQLLKMDLAENNLNGSIPVELATLPVLTELDISHNGFFGPIEGVFGNSPSLKLLNVSYNDISGPIPSTKTFEKMDITAFLGNPKLCGPPLRPCKNGISSELEIGSRRAQKLAWILVLCAVTILFVTGSVFVILHLRRRSNKGQWKMVSFSGLPQFTAKDVLRSFNYTEQDSFGKVVLPTGITVSIKKIEWGSNETEIRLQNFMRIGNVRHENLMRLLGVCYNNRFAYLLYEHLPNGSLADTITIRRDWGSKCRIVIGVAKALCFLHHGCYPAIPHGNLEAKNVLFDEKTEPRLAEYGLHSVAEPSQSPLLVKSRKETGGFGAPLIRDELCMDVYNFGELVLEILSNGRVASASEIMETSKLDSFVREVADNSFKEEVNSVIEVVLLCTRSRPFERPSMQEALKLLSGLKSVKNGNACKA
ncbi:hypothetical protein ACP275_11G036600 [Erythranthe tilingii]